MTSTSWLVTVCRNWYSMCMKSTRGTVRRTGRNPTKRYKSRRWRQSLAGEQSLRLPPRSSRHLAPTSLPSVSRTQPTSNNPNLWGIPTWTGISNNEHPTSMGNLLQEVSRDILHPTSTLTHTSNRPMGVLNPCNNNSPLCPLNKHNNKETPWMREEHLNIWEQLSNSTCTIRGRRVSMGNRWMRGMGVDGKLIQSLTCHSLSSTSEWIGNWLIDY